MAGNVVDLCFVMDCTGSMSSYIAACKNDIADTVGKIVTTHPDALINLGFVAYRDHCDGAKRIQTFPFNSNLGEFQQFVGELAATGGGDYPEDVLGGLWESANMGWSAPTRVLFHIFDAPPHGRPKYHDHRSDNYPDGHPDDTSPSQIFTTLRDNFVDYYMMKLTNSLEKMVRVFKEDAAAVDYANVEERPGVSDVSKVMEDVAVAVLSSMAVRISPKRHAQRVNPIIRPMVRASSFKVFCGIDFGTHGSAFATCTASDPVPRAGQNWGGAGVGVKTLTNVLLGKNKKILDGPCGFGDAALEKYLDMEPDEQRQCFFFRRFKMALYQSAVEDDDRKEKVDIEGRIKAANGKMVRSDGVLVEALKFMISHVMKHVETSYGVTDPADVQWILTVPAIWSQKSRKVMEKVARRAGIPTNVHDQLIVALEPECAAVVAQDALGLSACDCYMMIDCGGGTVDIACHEMVSGTEVREIYKASGGPWGATYIDDAFISFLSDVFGEDVVDSMHKMCETDMPGLFEEIIANFNASKTNVLPSDEKKNVNLSVLKTLLTEIIGDLPAINERLARAEYCGMVGGAEYNRRGMLTLSRHIWEKLFNVVLDPLVAHVRELLEIPNLGRRIQTLCIVGGFAESPILMDRMSNEFGGSRRVIRPPNPRLTVVKGAAKYGLMPTMIAERSAPKTIGIAIRDAWNPDKDPQNRRQFVRGEGYVVDNVFFPFIQAGQPIPWDMPPVVHYFEPVSLEQFRIEIYQSDERDPRFVPDHPCGVIGPIAFPEGFDHNLYDICVQIDFSGRMVSVKVQFGEEAVIPVDIDWE